MEENNKRRDFLKQVTTGAAILGTSILTTPMMAAAEIASANSSDADAWFDKIKGKHKIVFDVPAPNGTLPFAWPRVFLLTNQKTGTPENDCGVVVILRHGAFPFALSSPLWEKYKFGEAFKITDDATNALAIANPFWQPKAGTYKSPVFGEPKIGIDELQASGVMFCVCDVALTGHSAVTAEKTKQDAATVKQEWVAGMLPGIQIVPSGIWAVGRAQEHGCAYCFAG